MIECFKSLKFIQKIFFILFVPIILPIFLFCYLVDNFIDTCRVVDKMIMLAFDGGNKR